MNATPIYDQLVTALGIDPDLIRYEQAERSLAWAARFTEGPSAGLDPEVGGDSHPSP